MKRVVLFLSIASQVAMAQTAPQVPQVSVQGNCDLRVIPDRGRISFSAENQSKDQKEALARTTKEINKLREELSALKLGDLELKTTASAVYPVREWEKDKLVDKGYQALMTLELTTSEITRLGEAIQKASAVGIRKTGELQTFLSLERSREEYLRCLDVAAEDAKGKAVQLGKKLGFKIGDVLFLSEVPNVPRPAVEALMLKSASSDAVGAPPARIDPGSQQYTTNLQVTFSIK